MGGVNGLYTENYGYRLYSQFCGPSNFIITDGKAIAINEALNPARYRYFYSDKNNFDLLLPPSSTPETILHIINSSIFDCNYKEISIHDVKLSELCAKYDTIVVKPSVDSDSGKGVKIYHKTGNSFKASDGELLSVESVLSFGRDLIVQAGLKQHPDISFFNPTSVNTLRIATYRSVKDGKVHVLSHVLRMGKAGQEVDNSHNGGAIVWINKDGATANQCYNQFGERFNSFNGIDFSKQSFNIPSFNKALDLCVKVAESLPHIHLIQHDIAIDENGVPKVIEFNCQGFTVWFAQFWGVPAFGNFVPEIINYMKSLPQGKLYFRV